MKRKIVVYMAMVFCIWLGVKEDARAEILKGYSVATKEDGKKTTIDDVSKNDFTTYLCSVKYQGEYTQYRDLTDYLYSNSSFRTIPGLKNTNVMGENCSKMVPQGICIMNGHILISAYDAEKKYNSVIYVMSSTGKTLEATLVYPSISHVGGMAFDGSNLYVCNSTKKTVSVFDREYILDAVHLSVNRNLNSVKINKYKNLSVKTTASYCTYYDKRLWVGEFKTNTRGKIYGYKISHKYSTPSLSADRYIQAPEYAQGISFYEGDADYFIVSCSYGANDSTLRCYKLKDYALPEEEYNKGVGWIKKGDAYKVISMPRQSEQVALYKDKLFLLFESSAYEWPVFSETDCFIVFNIDKIIE